MFGIEFINLDPFVILVVPIRPFGRCLRLDTAPWSMLYRAVSEAVFQLSWLHGVRPLGVACKNGGGGRSRFLLGFT